MKKADLEKENERLHAMLLEVCKAFEEETGCFILDHGDLSTDTRMWWRENGAVNEMLVIQRKIYNAKTRYEYHNGQAEELEALILNLEEQEKKYTKPGESA